MLKELEIRGPFKGVNKLRDPAELSPIEAEDALNAMLDTGTIKRRPGWNPRVTVNGSDRVMGIWDYQQNDGTRLPLIKKGKKLFKIPEFAPTELPMSLTSADAFGNSTEPASFVTLNNRVYFCDSSSFGVTDGVAVYAAAIERPPNPATVLPGATGNPIGTYDYKYSYFASLWGQESFASDASTSLDLNKEIGFIFNLTASGDPRVDFIRIYRRKTSALESLWSFVTQIPNGTTSFLDNTLDNDIDALTVAPFSVTEALPSFRYLATNAGILFAAGADAFPTRVYHSREGQPWVPDQFFEVNAGGDNEPVTGIIAFEGALVVFKLRSIWLISGNSDETFYIRKVKSDIGCGSHHSIVPVDNLLYFFSPQGFYVFDGADAREISGDIRPDILQGRNEARDRYVVGVHDVENGIVIWGYSGAGSSLNDKMYAYFYRNSVRVGGHSWVPWTMGTHVTALALMSYTSATGLVKRPVIGVNNTLASFDGTVDSTATPIPFKWRTGRIDGGQQDRFKLFKELYVKVTKQMTASPVSLTVSYLLSDQTSPTTLFTKAQGKEILRGYLHRSSRDIRLQFDALGDVDLRALGLWVEGGRRL